MRDRNNCNPQLGQRRLAIGGNGDGSGRFSCGMVHSQLLQTTKMRTRLPQQLLCSHLLPACLPYCWRCTTHRHYCGEPTPKIL